MIAKEDQGGIVVLKWRDTRDVRILSTKHALIMAPVRSIHSHQSTHATAYIFTGFCPAAIYICTANHNHTAIYIYTTIFKSQHANITR